MTDKQRERETRGRVESFVDDVGWLLAQLDAARHENVRLRAEFAAAPPAAGPGRTEGGRAT